MEAGIISTIVGVVCTTIASAVTFLLTKRKYNSEVDSTVIQNINSAFDAYKKTMEATVELLQKRISQLEQENQDLRTQVNMLQQQLTTALINKLEALDHE